MRAKPDELFVTIAKYVANPPEFSKEAYETARLSLLDSFGCAILALKFRECVKRITPLFTLEGGFPVIGTEYRTDPINAAFSIGSQIRWLDFNDTWLGQEWGHPSDNLGALLPACERKKGKQLLEAMIKAYEIQGVLSLSNSFNRIGLDHVMLVKIASTAVSTHLLGGSEQEITDALSNAFIDLGPLRVYRHQPNVGPRKSWAAGDACARALFHAFRAIRGEPGYATALSDPKWGFEHVLFQGKPITLTRGLGDYVMRHILFKTAFPAEFHAQTAVEAAFKLYPQIKDKWDEIEKIEIDTHESAIRIIDKKGPLHNPADRDHCLQYMVAIGLLKGSLKADDYEAEVASDPRIDKLRNKMVVRENPQFSKDYLDPEKRSIANKLTITIGGNTISHTQEYPLGHRRRREECVPELFKKYEHNIRTLPEIAPAAPELLKLFHDQKKVEELPITELMALFTPQDTRV